MVNIVLNRNRTRVLEFVLSKSCDSILCSLLQLSLQMLVPPDTIHIAIERAFADYIYRSALSW